MRATTPRTYRNPSDRSTTRRYADHAARVVWDGRGRGDWRDTATREYVAARERGETVTGAYWRALAERVAADVLAFRDTWDTDIAGAWHVWEIDPAALTRVTSDPRTDALSGTVYDADGNRILARVILPDLATASVVLTHDDDATPADAECYTDADVDAWGADRWHYVHVSVTVRLGDGREGSAGVGGVELGDYWPGSDAAQIWHTVPELVAEALADAGHDRAVPAASLTRSHDDQPEPGNAGAPMWDVYDPAGGADAATHHAYYTPEDAARDIAARFPGHSVRMHPRA